MGYDLPATPENDIPQVSDAEMKEIFEERHFDEELKKIREDLLDLQESHNELLNMLTSRPKISAEQYNHLDQCQADSGQNIKKLTREDTSWLTYGPNDRPQQITMFGSGEEKRWMIHATYCDIKQLAEVAYLLLQQIDREKTLLNWPGLPTGAPSIATELAEIAGPKNRYPF